MQHNLTAGAQSDTMCLNLLQNSSAINLAGNEREAAMRSWFRSSTPSRFAAVVIAALLCGMGPAWAGGGGSDGGFSQLFLQQVCGFVGATSCPQLPTLTQIILGISGYQNTPPDFVRSPLGNFAGICSVSENGSGLPLCAESNAVTTVNPLAPSSIALTDLPNLTPLAFQAVSGQAVTP